MGFVVTLNSASLGKKVNTHRKLKFHLKYFKEYTNLFYSFGRRTHAGVTGEGQCALPFDGAGKVLAHAYFPSDGRIHFDDEERYTETGASSGWWLWKKESHGLLPVAVHEIGHALGLKHSNVKGSIMWPTAKKGTPTLHQDDINGIRYLYGECVHKYGIAPFH